MTTETNNGKMSEQLLDADQRIREEKKEQNCDEVAVVLTKRLQPSLDEGNSGVVEKKKKKKNKKKKIYYGPESCLGNYVDGDKIQRSTDETSIEAKLSELRLKPNLDEGSIGVVNKKIRRRRRRKKIDNGPVNSLNYSDSDANWKTSVETDIETEFNNLKPIRIDQWKFFLNSKVLWQSNETKKERNSISDYKDIWDSPPDTETEIELKEMGFLSTPMVNRLPRLESPKQIKRYLINNKLIMAKLKLNVEFIGKEYFYVINPNDGDVIYINNGYSRNRAFKGDIVIVKLLDPYIFSYIKDVNKKKTGKVIAIHKKIHHRTAVGCLTMRGNCKAVILEPRELFFPLLKIRKDTIPRDILEDLEADLTSTLFSAVITSWDINEFAYGVIKKKIGKVGDVDSEIESIFLELGIDQNSDCVVDLPLFPYQITEKDIISRLDLRREVVFSVDPMYAGEVDDAMSFRRCSDGLIEVGVHISDVCFFLKEDTPLDKIVSKRASSIYLFNGTHHMLPVELVTECSLLPGKDKLAISVLCYFDEEGEFQNVQVSRSVVNSCAQITFEEMEVVLSGTGQLSSKMYNGINSSLVEESIHELYKIINHSNHKRVAKGGITSTGFKEIIYFNLDDKGLPTELLKNKSVVSYCFIGELMKIANAAVGKFIAKSSNKRDLAIYRSNHPITDASMIYLRNCLKGTGIEIDFSSNLNILKSMDRYFKRTDDESVAIYRRYIRALSKAKYCSRSEGRYHFAAQEEEYVQFTSPIRDYAHIQVHRVVISILEDYPLPNWNENRIKGLASICNKKSNLGKDVSNRSFDICMGLYIRSNTNNRGLVSEAIIYWINSTYISVYIPSLEFHTTIYLEDKSDYSYAYGFNKGDCILDITWDYHSKDVRLKTLSKIKVITFCQDNLKPLTLMYPPSYYKYDYITYNNQKFFLYK